MPKMTAKTPPPTPLSIEMRLAVLEKSMQDLHGALVQFQALRAQPNKLPVMPEGTGMRLSEARRRAGWAGRTLAQALRVSPSTLSLWELEKLAIPRWRAEAIIEAFVGAGVEAPFVMPPYGCDNE